MPKGPAFPCGVILTLDDMMTTKPEGEANFKKNWDHFSPRKYCFGMCKEEEVHGLEMTILQFDHNSDTF